MHATATQPRSPRRGPIRGVDGLHTTEQSAAGDCIGTQSSPMVTRTAVVARSAASIAVLGIAAMALTWAAQSPSGAARADLPARPSLEADGLRYEFDALTGCERLWDLSDPSQAPRNVIRERAIDARNLRRSLERQLGVESLDELRDAHRSGADALRRLGYL